MNDTAQIITSIGTLLGVLGGILLQFLQNNQANESRRNMASTIKEVRNEGIDNSRNLASKIEEVHKLANGMKTELVNEVRAAALAKGEAKGEAKGKKEEKDNPSV